MSTRVGRFGVVVCIASCAALGAIGCLNGDDTAAPGGLPDAAINVPETSVPSSDASGHVDGAPGDGAVPDASPPPFDAGTDTGPVDAAPDVTPPREGGITGAAGLVPAGSLSKSTSFTLNGTVGPATAPVLKSPKYRLVGGMAVTTEHK